MLRGCDRRAGTLWSDAQTRRHSARMLGACVCARVRGGGRGRGRLPTSPYLLLRQVPERKLLVESDCADERSAAIALPLALRLVADARGWTLERAARTTTENGLRFLRGDDGDDRDAGGAERPVCVACEPTAGSDESARPRLLVVSQCSR